MELFLNKRCLPEDAVVRLKEFVMYAHAGEQTLFDIPCSTGTSHDREHYFSNIPSTFYFRRGCEYAQPYGSTNG
jgi:hypothetical protein